MIDIHLQTKQLKNGRCILEGDVEFKGDDDDIIEEMYRVIKAFEEGAPEALYEVIGRLIDDRLESEGER